MTEKLFNEIAAWQQDTFPGGTPDSTLHHLLDEIRELRYALRLDPYSSHEELADCMFLIFGCADRMGMSYQDIQDAIAAKFAINKARKWGKPKENGVVNHVEEPSVMIASPGEGAVIVEGAEKSKCFEFPAFGASYPDAQCSGGFLWDLDSVEDGHFTSGGDIPCPVCNHDAYIDHLTGYEPGDPEYADEQKGILEHMKFIYQKYGNMEYMPPTQPLTLPDNSTDMLMEALRKSEIN